MDYLQKAVIDGHISEETATRIVRYSGVFAECIWDDSLLDAIQKKRELKERDNKPHD